MPTRRIDSFLLTITLLNLQIRRRIAAGGRIILAVGLMLILLPLVCPGSFQLQADEDDISPIDETIEDLANLGPLYWRARIGLKDAGYDSNLYNTEEERQVGSFTATLTPGLDLFLPMGKRQLLWGEENLDVVFYVEDPPGIYLNNDAALGYDLYLKRAHLALFDRYVTRVQRPNEEIDARVRRNSNVLGGKLLIDLSSRVSAGLTHESDQIRYADEAVEPGAPENLALILDRTERNNGVVLRYAALPRTSFLLRVRHTDFDFRDPASTRESSAISYLAGAEFDPTGIINGELEMGYLNYTADLAPQQDYAGFIGFARVTWQTRSWLHLRVKADRDFRFSSYASNLYYLRRHLEGRVSLRIAGVGWLDLGYGWESTNYPVADVNIGTEEDPVLIKRKDEFTNPILGFRYQPREGMMLGFEARYRSRMSNFTWEYDRLFVTFNITLTR